MAIDFLFGPDVPPFQKAVDAFLAKEIMTRPDFDALSAQMKVKAFTAAYVHAADRLQTVYDATLKAIEKGTTLADFKKEAGEILTRPWHRETVFRTNVLSAYGKGHWDRAQAMADTRPYARYSAVMDGRTRPSHAALHGRVYPLDHPFWRVYWPPWGYNCRCGITTLSQGEVEAAGYTVSREMNGLPGPEKKFVSPAAGKDWQPDLGKYAVPVKQNVLEELLRTYRPGIFVDVDRAQYLALVKKQLTQADLNDLEVLLWAQDRSGIEGYGQWAEGVLLRKQSRGEFYPAGNIPGWVLETLDRRPRLALTVIEDRVVIHMAREAKQQRGATLSAEEIVSIPRKFRQADWYQDKQDPALLMAWVREGDVWIKVVMRLDQSVGKGVANKIVSGGVIQTRNIEDINRYKKI